MKKSIFKKLGLFFIYAIAAIYIAFLILPLCINPFIASYSDNISKMAEEASGLKIKIEGLKIITTPKLTIGAKIGTIDIKLPTGEDLLSSENIQAKLSLIPLLARKVEVDMFSVDYIDATLAVKPDGNFQIIDFLPEAEEEDQKEQLTELPLGLKLSNRLPNIYIKEYILTLSDMKTHKSYTLQGGNLKVTDFVLDKNVKFSTAGFAKLDSEKLFTYDLKITNRIMPNINLNDLIFTQNNKSEENEKVENEITIKNYTAILFDILNGVKKNGLTADITVDTVLSGDTDNIYIKGSTDIEKISILVNGKNLPDGHIKFQFKGKKSIADIVMYTAEQEETSIQGNIIHGKTPKIDLAVKSNAVINNIFTVIKSIASSFNYNDLNTLSATGRIDADFNIKTDLKTVTSSGYFKIPEATVSYGLYNVFIDKIKANIDLNGNIINFKDVGFKILSQPLSLHGTLSHTADADLHLIADKLLIKGLLTAIGQINLLKENDIKSGLISMDASIKGNLKNIIPVVLINLENVDITNNPTSTRIKLPTAKIDLSSDGKAYSGIVDANTISVINPSAKFSIPKVKVKLDEKNINIEDTYLTLDNSKIDISGKITDYTNKDMNINILAKGSIFSNDIKQWLPSDLRQFITAKGAMPILVSINGNDKKQTVSAQLLATPNGYFHLADLQSATGKSLLLSSDINIDGSSINIGDTGVYITGKTTLSENPKSNIGGSQIIKVSGSIPDYNNFKLKGLNIATLSEQTISIPTFNKSQTGITFDITMNGNPESPDIKGNAKLSHIDLPTIKTKLKDVTVDFGKAINVNLPLITIDNSIMNAKATVNPNFNNGIIIDSIVFNSNILDSDTLISAITPLLQGGSSNSAATSDLGIIIRTGKADVIKFKSGKIVATNLTGNFNLKNNIFYLKDLTGTAFKGKINGDVSCNVLKGNTTVNMKGENLSAVEAIEATAGIKNALSGKLAFDAKLALDAYAPTFNNLLKSVTGSVTFDVKDGNYMNIGTVDQFVLAGNIVSNTVMRAALLPIKTMPVVQSSSKFSEITGKVNLKNGIATLAPVKSSGSSVAYFVTGQYNIINGYTNVIVLGRMGADIVAVLGPLGQLSVSKIASYLPSFGAKTLTMLSSLTSDPSTEKVSEIPALTTNSTNSKDFKVVFVGNITNAASVKSFKWLSECDTTELQNASLKGQMQTSVNTIKQSGIDTINDAKKTVEDTKNSVKTTAEDIKNQVQKTKESIEELKNLKNMFKPKAETTQATPKTTAETTTTSPASTSTSTAAPATTSAEPAKAETQPQATSE